jgi:hypothetical protein
VPAGANRPPGSGLLACWCDATRGPEFLRSSLLAAGAIAVLFQYSTGAQSGLIREVPLLAGCVVDANQTHETFGVAPDSVKGWLDTGVGATVCTLIMCIVPNCNVAPRTGLPVALRMDACL